MATAALLQNPLLNLQLKTRLYHHRHPRQSPTRPSFPCFRVRAKSFETLSIVKCSFPDHNDSAHRMDFFVDMETKPNPYEIVAKSIMNALKETAAAALLVGLLLMCDPYSALPAGSGGRMGGRAFSSRSSSSSSSSSRSYSEPRTRSGSSWSSSSSRSYSAPRTGSGSDLGFSYSVPHYSTSPFGGVLDLAVGAGSTAFDTAVGAESNAFLLMSAFFAFVLVSGFSSGDTPSGSMLTATEKTSVLKLQVGLLGLGKSLQKDLNRIAETADTSMPKGLHYVLTETILALLRHPDYCISAYSSVTILVAAEGERELPSINNSTGLKEALLKLASIPSSRTLAVEVLWTPQNEDDALSKQELLKDYSLLRHL